MLLPETVLSIMAARSSGAMHLHDAVVFGGLAVTMVVVVIVGRTAHKAVMDAVSATTAI